MLLTVLMEAAFSSTKDHHIQPDRHPPSSRMQTVLRCASKLSNTQITELGSPRRWGVVKYFAEGGGRRFNVTNCDDDTSDFATLYGLRVLRDSTNMANPSWHQNNVLYLREVCEWNRIGCNYDNGIYSITHVNFNKAKLFGTIPPEVRLLRSLEYLQLCSNKALFGHIQVSSD